MVHIPTATTIYIDAAGAEETRTIMPAELVAIYTALTTFTSHVWIGIFTDSLFSLQAIQIITKTQAPQVQNTITTTVFC